MTTITQLERQADQRLAGLKLELSKTRKSLEPASIIDHVLRSLDPDFSRLNRWQRQVKNNPFALLAAFTGMGLLVRQLTAPPDPPHLKSSSRHKGRAETTHIGDRHGQFISTE
jgi:hypothetical protein